MNIKDMKDAAELDAGTIDLNWDKLANPTFRKEFESTLLVAVRTIPTLESLYTKLMSGKSILMPDEDTALNSNEVEQYSGAVREELYSAYVLGAVYDKYTLIQSITGHDTIPVPLPPISDLS